MYLSKVALLPLRFQIQSLNIFLSKVKAKCSFLYSSQRHSASQGTILDFEDNGNYCYKRRDQRANHWDIK